MQMNHIQEIRCQARQRLHVSLNTQIHCFLRSTKALWIRKTRDRLGKTTIRSTLVEAVSTAEYTRDSAILASTTQPLHTRARMLRKYLWLLASVDQMVASPCPRLVDVDHHHHTMLQELHLRLCQIVLMVHLTRWPPDRLKVSPGLSPTVSFPRNNRHEDRAVTTLAITTPYPGTTASQRLP